jgi:hypothetical protein
VQGDDLVAEDVIAWGEGGGDADGPLVAIGWRGMLVVVDAVHDGIGERTDELVGGPLVGTSIHDSSCVELEELQALFVGRTAVARTLGEVVDHGAVVGLGPGVPLE